MARIIHQKLYIFNRFYMRVGFEMFLIIVSFSKIN